MPSTRYTRTDRCPPHARSTARRGPPAPAYDERVDPHAAPSASIRAAGPRDAAALASLRYRWRALEAGESGLDEPAYSAALTTWLAEHERSHLAYLAEVGGAAVGLAFLAVIERVPGPGRWLRQAAVLQSVYVVPEQRDRGVGAALCAALLDEAGRRGLDYVLVHPSARSFPFYRRLGFSGSEGLLELRLVPR